MNRLPKRIREKILCPNACWLWRGAVDIYGYGHIYDSERKRPVPAHRLVYELLKGKIPEGKTLDHKCRVRCCVNPAHLEAMTAKENILRGEGACAHHARRTHCPKGHPLVELYGKRRKRGCPVCEAESARQTQIRKRNKERAKRKRHFTGLLKQLEAY